MYAFVYFRLSKNDGSRVSDGMYCNLKSTIFYLFMNSKLQSNLKWYLVVAQQYLSLML